MRALTQGELQATLARHIRMYSWHAPKYQLAMLNSLAEVWEGPHDRLLDVGGGTGIIAQVLQELFPAGQVTSVDVEDRFLPSLTIDTMTYGGRELPFGDASFDAATINNVLHHVSEDDRQPLIAEVRRVVKGPVYIKDHLRLGPLDDARLTVLDLMGNMPFKGMVKAHYLSRGEWEELAAHGGYSISYAPGQVYRRGAFAALFPNRLEIVMKWSPKQPRSH